MSKNTLITGSSGGIGSVIAHSLCSKSHNLILVARNEDKLITQKSHLIEEFPNAKITILPCDVSDPEEVKSLYSSININTIDVLINAAGISGGGITSDITDELWLNVINTNLNGMFYVTKELLRLNLMPEGGRIINIASTGGKQGVLHGAPYCASKHGMVGFTKALGLELARNGSGITVNAVCPGFVESEMAERVRLHYGKIWGTDSVETKRRIEARVPIGRYIIPEEVSAMVEYLLLPAAQGVTAQALNVCGGLGNY